MFSKVGQDFNSTQYLLHIYSFLVNLYSSNELLYRAVCPAISPKITDQDF